MRSQVTANWHLDTLTVEDDGSDPLQQMTEMIEAADPIEVTRDTAMVQADLQRLLEREGRFDANGYTCELKWQEHHVLMGGTEASCRFCPVRSRDQEEGMTAFCNMAAHQERLTHELRATQEAEALDAELCRAITRDMDEADAMAEAVLAAA